MPTSPSPFSSRTTFERWLNLPKNAPANDPRYNAIRSREKKWGSYMRSHYPDNFEVLYRDYWLTHPELWGEVYADNIPEEQIPYV